MTDLFIPPSPNWYCSRASDSNPEGLFAYGSRNRIQILDFREIFSKKDVSSDEKENGNDAHAGNFMSFEAHSDRVVAVVFSPKNPRLLCSGADDGTVKIWEVCDDREIKECVNEHNAHNKVSYFCM